MEIYFLTHGLLEELFFLMIYADFFLRDVEFWVNCKPHFEGLEMFGFHTLKFQNLSFTLEVLFRLY